MLEPKGKEQATTDLPTELEDLPPAVTGEINLEAPEVDDKALAQPVNDEDLPPPVNDGEERPSVDEDQGLPPPVDEGMPSGSKEGEDDEGSENSD